MLKIHLPSDENKPHIVVPLNDFFIDTQSLKQNHFPVPNGSMNSN